MKALTPLKKIVVAIVFSTASSLAAVAQEPAVSAEPTPPADEVRRGDHERQAFLFRELGLRPEQVEAIRLLNAERRPLMIAAQRRLRAANRSLDEAIYAETVDDARVETSLGEFQAAQAEMARLRFANELAVRKILDPAQLLRFRELRQRFVGERRMNRRESLGRRPLRRRAPVRTAQPPN